ncbi:MULTISPECIES: AMP-binding protein [Phytobacter]|uniref:AMP-binding protein n=1 Tax=Citrobacter bitternis TaxID=1585982 RepID=A0ABW1PY89_9ENTR|nr:AMP-binding protein [Phytobacter sp. SCO41]MBS6740612.1 AMP-binding protein [Enterobacteriaceae bacterium]PXW62193.1 acyl-CoA synthetase (AMP-forming)/AMP-acid ligase II [Grimontella sp. AG753]TCW48937.1 acyl-CoA synthetase (AMP-forming)/AMP-acid ligase II [Phytobacter diazotrophicus]
MSKFYDLSQPASRTALIDDRGMTLSYGELAQRVQSLAEMLPSRTLVFIFCRNQVETVVGYLACLQKDAVALLLDDNLDATLIEHLIQTYKPSWLWRPIDDCYQLLNTGLPRWPLHDSLALLMTTSGSTGSPKLVRLSKQNLESNAASIAQYLGLTAEERGLVSLPINYVYGLSIINSHLSVGATLLLTGKSVMQRELWNFVREERASSFAGVPYTYEILKKLRFMRMDLPDLRTLTQAGGKLSAALQQEFTEYAEQSGKQFIVMYGAAEATSRMAWLAPQDASTRYGSIGKPIPGGEFMLLDSDDKPITTPGVAGELVYRGANVALGYAEKGEDLTLGDQFAGTLHTGDIATCDADGFYSIIGRKKRFLKIFGNRVGMDEMESLLKNAFPGITCACDGRDDLLCIFLTDASLADTVKHYAANLSKLHASAFRIIVLDAIPVNAAGKTLYHRLKNYVPSV